MEQWESLVVDDKKKAIQDHFFGMLFSVKNYQLHLTAYRMEVEFGFQVRRTMSQNLHEI